MNVVTVYHVLESRVEDPNGDKRLHELIPTAITYHDSDKKAWEHAQAVINGFMQESKDKSLQIRQCSQGFRVLNEYFQRVLSVKVEELDPTQEG